MTRGRFMKLGKLLASATVAASLVSAPVMAQAATADLRNSADVEGESLSGGFLIPALALIAVILGIIVLVDDGDDAPVSP